MSPEEDVETLMIRQRQRTEKEAERTCIYPADTHTHTKTEAVAGVVSFRVWWALRSQVRPTQSPFSCAVGSTNAGITEP